MSRRKWSIAFIIVIVLTFIITVVLVIFASLFSSYERDISIRKLDTKLKVYSEQLSKVLVKPLWNYDNDLVTDIMVSQMNDPDIFAIIVYDPDSVHLIQMRTRGSNWEIVNRSSLPPIETPVISKSRSVWFEGSLLGHVNIIMSQKNIISEIQKKTHYIFLGFIIIEVSLILGIFLMLWLVVIKPVKAIEKYAVLVSSSSFDGAVQPFPQYLGELSVLNHAITQMVEILNHRYVELQVTEKKFRNLFERTPVSIWLEDVTDVFVNFNILQSQGVKDFRGYLNDKPDELIVFLSMFNIIEVNKASCKLFESSDEQTLVENLHSIFLKTTVDVFKEGIIQLFEKNHSFESEAEMNTLTNKKIYVILRWSLISNTNNTQHLLVSINDITYQKMAEIQLVENERELKQNNEEYYSLNEELSESNHRILKINEELQLAKEKAEESDNLKTAFLCNMSHEIRTPLNAIVGFADLLTHLEVSNAKIHEYVSVIQSSSGQLLSIVNDILSMSRIQTGQEIVSIRPVYLNNVFENTCAMFTSAVHVKKLRLSLLPGSDDSDFCILTDETKLVQIITNLLHNAIKFTRQGSIEFGYSVNDSMIDFFVKDTGIGISEQAQSLIFERFRQADTSISSDYGGTGLGLSISKAFAEMLGGKLTVTSEINVGSTFTLSIPNRVYYEKTNSFETHDIKVTDRKITILVAEDEIYNFQLLEDILASQKYTVIRAVNGLEALEICQANDKIDLILMDIQMPVMDGLTAFDEIRKIRPAIPVIAQTAYALESDKQKLLGRGFNEYLSKPIKKAELLQKILQFT